MMDDLRELPTWLVLAAMIAVTVVIAAVLGVIDVRDPGVEWPDDPPPATAAP